MPKAVRDGTAWSGRKNKNLNPQFAGCKKESTEPFSLGKSCEHKRH